jgi:hypothetical protein
MEEMFFCNSLRPFNPGKIVLWLDPARTLTQGTIILRFHYVASAYVAHHCDNNIRNGLVVALILLITEKGQTVK